MKRVLAALPPGTAFRIGASRGIVLSQDAEHELTRVATKLFRDDERPKVADWHDSVRVEVLPERPFDY